VTRIATEEIPKAAENKAKERKHSTLQKKIEEHRLDMKLRGC
jgi:cell fate regulator YaaT (PSP1 superfamily)